MNPPNDVAPPENRSDGVVSEAGVSGRTLERLGYLLAGLDQLDMILALPEIPAVLDPPLKFAGYSLISRLGSGRFGIVLLAVDIEMNRRIVIKVPQPMVLAEPESLDRFIREPRAASRLDHPGIVSVLSTGTCAGLPFLSAVYVPGPSLAQWRDRCPEPIAPAVAAGFIEKIADAAQHAHERGILHCDLKPSNVLLQPAQSDAGALHEFRPVITDFGLARIMDDDPSLTKTFRIAGTPNYMAPEQLTGQRRGLTARVDVYAMGMILCELLKGTVPTDASQEDDFGSPDLPFHALSQRLPASTPKDLRAICEKCLCVNPDDRYASAGALAADLERFIQRKPVSARELPSFVLAVRWLKANPRFLSMALLAIASVVTSVMLVVSHRMKSVQSLADLAVHTAELSAASYRVSVMEDERKAAESMVALNLIRHRRLIREAEWKRQNYSDLQELAVDAHEEIVPALRTELSAVAGAFDLGNRRDLCTDFQPYDVAFAPDSRTLAVGSFLPDDHNLIEVRLMDSTFGDQIRTLEFLADAQWEKTAEGRRDCVWSLTFDAAGRHLVAGTRSGRVVVWDLNLPQSSPLVEWSHIDSPRQHASGKHLRVSRCGFDHLNRLWTENNGAVAVWDPANNWKLSEQHSGYMTRPNPGAPSSPIVASPIFHTRDVASGIFIQQTEDAVLSLGTEQETVRELLQTYSDRSEDGPVTDICLDPSGHYLFSTAEHVGHLKVWDLAGCQLVVERTLIPGSLRMSVNSNGTQLAVCEADHVAVFDIQRPDCRVVQGIQPLPIADARLSHDESKLTIVSESRTNNSDQNIIDIRMETLKPDHSLEKVFVTSEEPEILRESLLPELPGQIFQHDHDSFPEIRRTVLAPSGNSRICVHINKNSTEIITCSEIFVLSLDIQSGNFTRTATVQDLRNLLLAQSGTRWLLDGTTLQRCEPKVDSELQDVPSQVLSTSEERITCIADDRQGVLAGTHDGKILRFTEDGNRTFEQAVTRSPVTAIHSNGARVVAGTATGELVILKDDEVVVRVPTAHNEQIRSIAVGPNGGVSTGGADRMVRLWNSDGQLFCEWPQTRQVTQLWISSHEPAVFILCSGENAIQRWNLALLNQHFEESLHSSPWCP